MLKIMENPFIICSKHTIMLVKLLYYDTQNEDPLMYITELSNTQTIQQIIYQNIKEIEDIKEYCIYQQIDSFVSPELPPHSTVKQIIPSDIIELLIQRRISDDEMLTMINGIQNETSSQLEEPDINMLSEIQLSNMDTGTIESTIKSTQLQTTQSFLMRTSQLHKMATKSSKVSSVNFLHYQQLRDQQREFSSEYSWVNDYQSSPLYFDKAESTNLDIIKQYLEQNNIKDIIVACVLGVTQTHTYDINSLIQYCQSFINEPKLVDQNNQGNEYLISVIRNQYGGWCVLFFQLNKKDIALVTVLPICCRYAINIPSEDIETELWKCNYDSFSQNIQNSLVNLEKLQDQPQNTNQKYLFMLRLDGLNITFKTTLGNAVLLQQTLNIAIREISGVFQKHSAGTQLFEYIIHTRMQSIKCMQDIIEKCQLSNKNMLSQIQSWIQQNTIKVIEKQNINFIAIDLVNYIYKYACTDIQISQKILNIVTQYISELITQNQEQLIFQAFNLIEQLLQYPSHPDSSQLSLDYTELQQISKNIEEHNISQKVKQHIKQVCQQLGIVKEEQITRHNILPQQKNPPTELINQGVDIEKIEDPTAIQYNSVYLSILQLGPNNQIRTNSQKTVLVSNICPTSDLIFFNLSAQYLINLLTFLPQLVKSKIKVMNLNNTLATLVRKLRKLLETEDVSIEYSLLYPVIFNRKDFNKLYNQSTVVFYIFYRGKKDGDLPIEQFQKYMTKMYGNVINAPQLFFQNVDYAFLDNTQKICIKDETKFYYFLIISKQHCYQQYGIEFLINKDTDFLFYESQNEQVGIEQLFLNVECFDRNSMTIQQINKGGYENMYLVLASLKTDDDSLVFMNFMQVSMKFLLYSQKIDVFNSLLTMYIKSLDALTLYKQSVEDPDDMPKLPKNDLDTERFDKYMNKYFQFYKQRIDVKQYKNQTIFNNNLLYNSPLNQLIVENYQFDEIGLQDDELYLFQDIKLQNYLGMNTITPEIDPEYVQTIYCEQYEEDTTYINKSLFDTILNEQPSKQIVNKSKTGQIQLSKEDIEEINFNVQFNDIKSLVLEMIDKIELQEQQKFISKQSEEKQFLVIELQQQQQQLNDALLYQKQIQQEAITQIQNQEQHEVYLEQIERELDEQATYQELICKSVNNFISINQYINNIIDGIETTKQVKYAIYQQKQLEAQSKFQNEIINRRKITKEHLKYLEQAQENGMKELQTLIQQNQHEYYQQFYNVVQFKE